MPSPVPFVVPDELEKNSPAGIPFMIDSLSSQSDEHELLMSIHRHSFYALGICLEGESSHMLDFQQVVVRTGEMLLLVPGQVHQPLDVFNGKGYFIAFKAEFLLSHPILLPNHITGPVRLSESDFEQSRQIFANLIREYNEQPPQYVQMLQHYLALLITLYHRHNEPAIQSGPPLLIRYRELLATHFLEWTKPAQYASAMHVSADHLNEVVKQHTGHTLSAHINERRILEAKRLLLHASESIKEIAWQLQFNEVSYFNRFFKQHTGTTPAAFRERVREKYPPIPE